MQPDKEQLWKEVFLIAIQGKEPLTTIDIEQAGVLADKAIVEVEKRIEADREAKRHSDELWRNAGWDESLKRKV